MNTPVFELSLRITHPNIQPREISTALGLDPHIAHCVGEPRKTPKGTPLEGVYPHSYWSYRLSNIGNVQLSKLIASMNRRIDDKLPFLMTLTDTGGRLEYFIGCFVPSHAGDTLDWELLQECARLKINLSFDMYGQQA